MAKHGIKGMIGGGAAAGGAAEKVIHAWQQVQASHGREMELGGDLIIGFSYHIANTQEKAIEEASSYFEEHMKMFAPLGFVRGLTDKQIEAIADPQLARTTSLPTLQDAVEAGSWLCGPPELIIEKLMDVQKRYPGLDQVTVNNAVGTPESVILEQLDQFAEEIMPAFKN